MPEIISLDAAKAHLRVDGAGEDLHITDLVAAATSVVQDHLGRPIIDEELGWPTIDAVPPNVIHAVKAVLADLYLNREKPLADDKFLDRLIGRHVVVSFG